MRVAVVDAGWDGDHWCFTGLRIQSRDFAGSGPPAGESLAEGTHRLGVILSRLKFDADRTTWRVARALAGAGPAPPDRAAAALAWCLEGGAGVAFCGPGVLSPVPALQWLVRRAATLVVAPAAPAQGQLAAAFPEVLWVGAGAGAAGGHCDLLVPGEAYGPLPGGGFEARAGPGVAAAAAAGAAAALLLRSPVLVHALRGGGGKQAVLAALSPGLHTGAGRPAGR